jgi:Domain of unknown function (DUF4331)
MKWLTVVAALVAVAVAVPLSFGSSHREAPLTSMDPTGDDTDLYAWTANNAPGSVTIASNWIPFEDPSGGPNFYSFDPKARYYINIDNTGDGVADVKYLFRFKTHIRDRNTYLYAKPTVDSVSDPDLNVRQTYSVTRLAYRRGKLVSSRKIGGGPTAPNNAGKKTIPNYDQVAAGAIRGLRGGGKVFAGQRDDPFFIDLTVPFDALNFRVATGNQGGGVDDVAGYSTHSVVLQVPERQVTRDHKSVSGAGASNAVVGVWSSTERRRLQLTNSTKSHKKHNGYVQVSRLGNPLVNEVVIPLGKKDQFNRTRPGQDAKLYGKYVLNSEVARLINALYPGVVNAPEKNRTDIVQALLTGVPGLTQIGKKPAAADTLKLNLGVAPNPSPNRFGVLANDTAGFPNGRRLGDDVVDIETRVIAGFLKGNKAPLGDGVDQNDKPFASAFPYLASPTAANDSNPKRLEPTHPGTPAQP